MKLQHLWADVRYHAHRAKGWFEKTIAGAITEVPSSVPERFSSCAVDKDVAIPMRDGIRLFADVYRPTGEGRFPVVLIRMPYGKGESYCYLPAHGRYWAKRGYVCVIQDVRGKWSSEVAWDPFVNEIADGYDTVDWVANQPWCDGNIGMTGESYYGYTQLAAAVSQHPNLKCIVPGDTAANIYGIWVYNSHALCLQTMGVWAPETASRTYQNFYRLNPWHLPMIDADDSAGIASDYYKEWIRRPLRDDYWQKINLDGHYEKITIPVLSWGGWYDTFLKGTIDDWAGIRAAARSLGGKEHQHLLIAGTDHEVTPMWTGRIGKLEVGRHAWSYDKILEFFDFYLKGIDNGFGSRGPVQLFVTGQNEWRCAENWPLPATEFTEFFLHSGGKANTASGDGQLSQEMPGNETADSFSYDPANPVQETLKQNMWRRTETLRDRAEVEGRSDVLCFSTPVLEAELQVIGPLSLKLFASSSAEDTDFTATLVDVFPDGYVHLLQEGIVRARFRNPAKGEQLLIPGEVYEFTIDMWATGHVFKAGHRLRLEISSSNFDRYDRNLNVPDRLGHTTRMKVARQTIFHDRLRPSALKLPIVPSR